ncbi:unnamed protein product [Caretta caretta]
MGRETVPSPSYWAWTVLVAPGTGISSVDGSQQENPSKLPESDPKDKETKHVYLLGQKSYFILSLQMKISDYQALLAKYNHVDWSALQSFIDQLPPDYRDDFQTTLVEGYVVTKIAKQAALDLANTVFVVMATMVTMCHTS